LNSQVELLTDSNVTLQEQINDMDSWWRNPYLWLGVGIVLGTGATVGIVYAVKG